MSYILFLPKFVKVFWQYYIFPLNSQVQVLAVFEQILEIDYSKIGWFFGLI